MLFFRLKEMKACKAPLGKVGCLYSKKVFFHLENDRVQTGFMGVQVLILFTPVTDNLHR